MEAAAASRYQVYAFRAGSCDPQPNPGEPAVLNGLTMQGKPFYTARVILTLAVFSVASSTVVEARDQPYRIMPVGDSLTSSIEGQASYRYWLWKRLERTRYNVDFVGSRWGIGNGASAIYADFDQDHEGYPGATTSGILYGISGWASQAQPDIVLLVIGANDIDRGLSPEGALENTRQIIATLRSVNPNVTILWGLLPPPPQPNPAYKMYNSQILGCSRAWSTRESPIRVVNLWSGYWPSRDTVDGDHPNASGEQKFAARFFGQLYPTLLRLHRQEHR